MKNILLQKIPINDCGYSLISTEQVLRIHNYIKDTLPKDDNYILITSPMDIVKVDGDMKIISIDCKSYSYEELKDIIEKASMYDDLCK
jgi:hypothetical protein